MEDETDPAFEAFATYRDLGPDRSLKAVAQELGKSASLISRWSVRHSWGSRVRAWDVRLDLRRTDEILDTAATLSRQHAAELRTHVELLMLPVLELSRRLARDPTDLQDINSTELMKLAVRATRPFAELVKLERQVLGVEASCETCRSHEQGRRAAEQLSESELDAQLLGLD
jgi:hypothetical protein